MAKNLVNITDAEIGEAAVAAVENSTIPIMHSKNKGDENHEWDIKDFVAWLREDIDD